jgi:hypothetical protein
MVDWFEFSKTFAGPIATVFAAAAAVFFTWRLGKAQVRIAQSQRDIAFDKLKYDLFDKRYEIYQTAKAIIEPMLSESPMLSASPAVILSRTRSESGVRRDDPESPFLLSTRYPNLVREHS